MHLPTRWPVMILSATLAVFIAVVGFLSQVDAIAAQQDAAVAVSVVDFAFDPGTISVPVGTTVTWTNTGSRPHTITADDGSFDSGRLDPGEQFSQTFDKSGPFTYHCGFHPDMQGSIVVTEAPQQAAASGEATPAAAESATSESAPASATAGPLGNLEPVEPSRLAHIPAGTCDELGIVVYSFPDLKTYRLDEGGDSGVGAIELITGTTKTPLSELFGEPFSVHVHESAQNKQTYIACSDIGSKPADAWSE